MTVEAGVLPIDKPAGPTSHDVVATARRALGIRRIGHTGTLDPFASGLLLLCLGTATRLAEYLTSLRKRYVATIRLGQQTDTDDLQGRVIHQSGAWTAFGPDDVMAAVARQHGDIDQLPPRYSAKKIAGERMYAAARRGDAVAAEPVRISIYTIEMTRFDPPDVEIELECSSGTYVRAIARDIGADLGVGAHLTALRRTHIGAYAVTDALALADLRVETAAERLIPPADAVAHLPRLSLSEVDLALIRFGAAVPLPDDFAASGPIAVLSETGALVAIGEAAGDTLRPRKVFA
jgi:tRNA pseudouridine55 synthase